MATTLNERAPFQGGRRAMVGLASLALAVVVGVGIWQAQSATDLAPSIARTEAFSPEAIRVRNAAGVSAQGEAFSPEAIRVRNAAGVSAQGEAFSPELMRMKNLAEANGVSWFLGSD